MKKLFVLLILPMMLMTTGVQASGTHSHDGSTHSHDPISEETAVRIAKKKIAQLVEAGKIEASWSQAALIKAEQKDFGKGLEWVVSFQNDKATDPDKRTIYVFYNKYGRYLATNFTGN